MIGDKFDMMTIEKIINDIVLILLHETEYLREVGIGGNKLFARVLGYDEYGLWIEHPKFEIAISEDDKGKPLPPDQVRREKLNASILISWKNIASLVHFPNRKGFDFPSPFERHIGFIADDDVEKEGE